MSEKTAEEVWLDMGIQRVIQEDDMEGILFLRSHLKILNDDLLEYCITHKKYNVIVDLYESCILTYYATRYDLLIYKIQMHCQYKQYGEATKLFIELNMGFPKLFKLACKEGAPLIKAYSEKFKDQFHYKYLCLSQLTDCNVYIIDLWLNTKLFERIRENYTYALTNSQRNTYLFRSIYYRWCEKLSDEELFVKGINRMLIDNNIDRRVKTPADRKKQRKYTH